MLALKRAVSLDLCGVYRGLTRCAEIELLRIASLLKLVSPSFCSKSKPPRKRHKSQIAGFSSGTYCPRSLPRAFGRCEGFPERSGNKSIRSDERPPFTSLRSNERIPNVSKLNQGERSRDVYLFLRQGPLCDRTPLTAPPACSSTAGSSPRRTWCGCRWRAFRPSGGAGG